YTFIYKEVFVPESAPINISLDLEISEVNAQTPSAGNQSLVPVEMSVSAKNPSTRQIALLSSGWIAYGYKVVPRPDSQKIENTSLSSKNGMSYLNVYSNTSARSLVAFGRLFSDDAIAPNEVLKRKLVFYVPPNTFSFITVQAIVPSVT